MDFFLRTWLLLVWKSNLTSLIHLFIYSTRNHPLSAHFHYTQQTPYLNGSKWISGKYSIVFSCNTYFVFIAQRRNPIKVKQTIKSTYLPVMNPVSWSSLQLFPLRLRPPVTRIQSFDCISPNYFLQPSRDPSNF